MTNEELQRELKAEIDSAINYTDYHLSSQRTKAIHYYRGDLFGTEEEGRSQVVMTTLRDTVQQVMPSLMRVFAGSDKVVEYAPRSAEDVPMAEQATDYANYVLMQDNPGYRVIYGACKDALYQKVGITKAYYDESVEVRYHRFTGLNLLALNELFNDPDVEFVEVEEGPNGEFDVELKRMKKRDRIVVENLPPEEFLIDRKARSLRQAQFVAHRCKMVPHELVAMGYPKELVDKHKSTNDDLTWNRERHARNRYEITDADGDSESVLYIEAYIYRDVDEDGLAELRRVCLMGDGYEVVDNEPWDMIPFADWQIDPEPHTFIGHDLADRTMDLQRINSEVTRAMLDSLAQSINPRMAVVEGKANMNDVLNNETGGVIRQDAPGMVQPLAQPFVGKEAMPVLEMFDQIKEARTGISRQAAGLDADALQSMTASAVSAIEQGSKMTLEVMARNLAETGFKKLMGQLLQLITKHQDQPRMVRLRNEWVDVDPSTWDAQMDVCVNVALGSGLEGQKMAVLGRTLEIQQAALAQMGISNPLVGLGQVRYTLGEMLELSGFQDTSRFFNPLPIDFQVPPPEPQPTPEELLAEAQREATYAEVEMKRADLQLKERDMMLQDDRERDKAAADFAIELVKAGVKQEEIDMKSAREAMQAGANP